MRACVNPLSLPDTHTHTHTLNRKHTHKHTLALSFSLSLSPRYTYSHTHKHTHTHTHTHKHTIRNNDVKRNMKKMRTIHRTDSEIIWKGKINLIIFLLIQHLNKLDNKLECVNLRQFLFTPIYKFWKRKKPDWNLFHMLLEDSAQVKLSCLIEFAENMKKKK